jgi:ParB/RepB/Spo0J family partition protein
LQQEIARDGLFANLIVRKKRDHFELIDGERRWRALKALGWKTAPVRIIEIDDARARRSVYKLNKIRENYTVEEEARYFKKLTDDGMTPWEVSKQLNVDFHWILAHLNVFKFPATIQDAVWNKQLSISHIATLESTIGRSLQEAQAIIDEILERRLTVAETTKIVRTRKAQIEKLRLEAAKKALPKILPKLATLKTPTDYEQAAKALKKVAKQRRRAALTPQERAAQEAERKRKWKARLRQRDEQKKKEQQRIRAEATKLATQLVEETTKAKTQTIHELTSDLQALRARIQTLQNEKAKALEKRDVLLTKALSFNCPHCHQACMLYREGEQYWVE